MKKYDKFFAGIEANAYNLFGAHKLNDGVEFCVFAPNARQAEVYMSNNWGNSYKMNKIDSRGIWHLFIDNLELCYIYKYRFWINDREYVEKNDPFAYFHETAPKDASIMYDLNCYTFSKARPRKRKTEKIYRFDRKAFRYQDLETELIPFMKKNRYSCISFKTLFEYFEEQDKSTAFFAPTSRAGTPYDFMKLIDELHKNNIKVVVDTNLFNFGKSKNLLTKLDGSYLYEKDEKDTFDLSKSYVLSFLISSGFFLIEKYHVDGLRLINVDRLLKNGSDENEDGVKFLKLFISTIKHFYPDVELISDYGDERVLRDISKGGIGFDRVIDSY
ncbi:MAG: hypothetical protein PUB48_01010 [Solobacterium sp.]|nr:hypothetical protein [Solobacterium sp.]